MRLTYTHTHLLSYLQFCRVSVPSPLKHVYTSHKKSSPRYLIADGTLSLSPSVTSTKRTSQFLLCQTPSRCHDTGVGPLSKTLLGLTSNLSPHTDSHYITSDRQWCTLSDVCRECKRFRSQTYFHIFHHATVFESQCTASVPSTMLSRPTYRSNASALVRRQPLPPSAESYSITFELRHLSQLVVPDAPNIDSCFPKIIWAPRLHCHIVPNHRAVNDLHNTFYSRAYVRVWR